MIQGVIYKIVGRQLPGEFCRASAPGQRVAEMSAVQAEWSNRNGLSVDVRPEEAGPWRRSINANRRLSDRQPHRSVHTIHPHIQPTLFCPFFEHINW